jgi:hypothetical protein
VHSNEYNCSSNPSCLCTGITSNNSECKASTCASISDASTGPLLILQLPIFFITVSLVPPSCALLLYILVIDGLDEALCSLV